MTLPQASEGEELPEEKAVKATPRALQGSDGFQPDS